MSTVALHTAAPDFELVDYNGMPFHLRAQLAKSHVLLVFNRGFR